MGQHEAILSCCGSGPMRSHPQQLPLLLPTQLASTRPSVAATAACGPTRGHRWLLQLHVQWANAKPSADDMQQANRKVSETAAATYAMGQRESIGSCSGILANT